MHLGDHVELLLEILLESVPLFMQEDVSRIAWLWPTDFHSWSIALLLAACGLRGIALLVAARTGWPSGVLVPPRIIVRQLVYSLEFGKCRIVVPEYGQFSGYGDLLMQVLDHLLRPTNAVRVADDPPILLTRHVSYSCST